MVMVVIRPLVVPVHGIRSQTGNVDAVVGPDLQGKGTLYITEAIISWINGETGEGFTIPYKRMTLHAISRDPAVHPLNCLYIMVNGTLEDDDENPSPMENNDDDEEETTEVRFAPEDPSVLDDIYKAIQDCTLLHPDPASDMSEEEEEEDINEAYEPGLVEEGGEGPFVEDDDYDYYMEQQRQIGDLQAFLRSRLRLGQGRGPNIGNGHQNGNGSAEGPPPPPFDPDQFADAEEEQ